jgi:LacI family transcriptional regulator
VALNYRSDRVARGILAGQTFLVGLVIPDLKQSFFAEIATAVEASLVPAGYHLLISQTGESSREEATTIDRLSRRVDGLIIASAQRDARSLAKITTPYVLIDRQVPGLNAAFVGARNDEIGFIATEHLIEQGCRRVAHLRGSRLSVGVARMHGYRRAIEKHGLESRDEWVVDADHEENSGCAAMQTLLKLKARPDGVFCFNEPIAVGALRAILGAGLKVPQDVALVGVANMHYADWLTVPLSTVGQDTESIGALAARRLLQCISVGRRAVPQERVVRSTLIPRASSLKRTDK